MIDAPERIWDFWPLDGGSPVVWREPCPFPADDAEVFEYIRADLAKPKVTTLKWGASERQDMMLQANCPYGRYYIADRGEYGFMWWRPKSPAAAGRFTLLETAKAAAQADYERRILEALK